MSDTDLPTFAGAWGIAPNARHIDEPNDPPTPTPMGREEEKVPCTCGIGNMFARFLHQPECPCHTHGYKPPPSKLEIAEAEIERLRAQLAAAEGQARGSEAMLIQAQRDCDNAQNAELVALSQLAEMTKERDDMRRTYELKVQDFASETRRATQLSDELKAERENNATLRQTANWNTALGVLEMREQIHVGGAGSIKGMCANCQTWHPLYEIYPECSDCFDETTQRRAVERLTTALAERDAQVGRIAKLDWYYADVQGNIEKAFLVADIDAALASAANAEGKSDSDSTGPRATEEG